MKGRIKRVELHQAFMWTCHNCGRDNFERAITLSPEQTSRLAEADERIDDEGCYLIAPSRVTCDSCSATFRASES